MSAKTQKQRSAEYRDRRKAAADPNAGPLALFIQHMQDEIAWLRSEVERLTNLVTSRDATNRHGPSHVTNGVTELAGELTGTTSGFGGKGGSGSGSLSLSGSSEKPGESGEFQDLNGETRAPGYLRNGTRVPGRLGDENSVTKSVTDRHVVTSRNDGTGSVFDSQKAETEIRKKPLKDAEMAAKARSELDRLAEAFK